MRRQSDFYTMEIPNDPVILLSFINMKLRDYYRSLDALCEDMNIEREELVTRLRTAGYEYNEQQNRFW